MRGITCQSQRDGRQSLRVSAIGESKRGSRLLFREIWITHERLTYRSFRLVKCRSLFFIQCVRRLDGAPHQSACFDELPAIQSRVRFVVQHLIFISRLAHQLRRLPLHPGSVVSKEVDPIEDGGGPRVHLYCELVPPAPLPELRPAG